MEAMPTMWWCVNSYYLPRMAEKNNAQFVLSVKVAYKRDVFYWVSIVVSDGSWSQENSKFLKIAPTSLRGRVATYRACN